MYGTLVWLDLFSLNNVIVTRDTKQVACDMGYTGEDGDERLQLVSFHSTSKVTTNAPPIPPRGAPS